MMDFWEKLRLRKCLSGWEPPWFCVEFFFPEPFFSLGTVVLLIHFNLFVPSLIMWVQIKHLGECNVAKCACNCEKTNKEINKQSPVKVHAIDRQQTNIWICGRAKPWCETYCKDTKNQTKQPWEVDLWMEIEQISGKLIVQALEWEWAASEKRDTQYISY